MSRLRLAAAVAVLVFLVGPLGAEPPSAELSRVLKAQGAPSLLWGRLAVEEESPEGAWTPLTGVAVTLYPYTAGLGADLERIRDGARATGRDYDAAVARVQERLQAHAADVAALTGTPYTLPAASEPRPEPVGRERPAPSGRPPLPGGRAPGRAAPEPVPPRPAGPDDESAQASEGPIRRTTTDPAGLFVFPAVPAGEWLLVAIHTSPYTATRRSPPSARAAAKTPGNRDGFLERERSQVKEAEVWVSRVRVTADQPARLLLSERSRFMVGPIR